MNTNQINLARGFVWNARQRQTIYRGMIGYLLIAYAALAFTVNRATQRVQAGLDLNCKSQEIERRFSKRYPGQPGMEAYARQFKESLQKKNVQAAAINEALPATTYSTLPLLNLLADPAQSGRMNKLSFTQKGKQDGKPELVFSIMVPAMSREAGVETPASLQRWRKDPALAREFTAITPTTTEQGSVGGEAVSILKYKAIFKE